MSEWTMGTLAKRLEGVERENRRMKRAGAVVLAVIAAAILTGWHGDAPREVHDVVEAKQFVVHDTSGNHRAMLGTGPDGFPRLVIWGNDPKAHLALFMSSDGEAVLRINDKMGMSRIFLGITPAGSPFLTLHGVDGKKIWRAP